MMKAILGLLLTFIYVGMCKSGEAVCRADSDGGSCERDENKYSQKSNEIYSEDIPEKWKSRLDSIKSARDKYVPCSGCDCYSDFLRNDLSQFHKISHDMLSKIRENVRHVVTYQIIQGKLYRSKDCLFPIRCQGVEHFLLKLASENISDTELVINMHDWPFINKHFEKKPLPLFSFSKTEDYYDISYPAWSFWAGGPATSLYPTGLGRWDIFRETLSLASQSHPWHSKLNQAFFRGSRTSNERDNLILLSRKNPTLADAKYTKNQAWKSIKDTLDAEPAEEVSLDSHCKYRYLFNFRGVAASFRFKHLFLCNSVVIHVGDDWNEFFYKAMVPWIHYVPMEANASEEDIADLLAFLKGNQELSEMVAVEGKRFVEENLGMEEVVCYWRRLVEGYTKLLDFRPEMSSDYVEIKEK